MAQRAAGCEVCGAEEAELAVDGRWRCRNCGAEVEDESLSLLVEGTLAASADGAPAVVIDDETWSWTDLGDALAATLAVGHAVELHLRADGADDQSTPVTVTATVSPLPLREPDDVGQEAEALALLSECLPLTARHPCPDDQLVKAAAVIRTHGRRPELPWSAIAAAAGWEGRLPEDDRDLWLDAALLLAAPRRPLPLPEEMQDSLASLEHDDWLSTVIELTRAGAGTPVDPQSLLVLSARCMDIDSGAVDPATAAIMEFAFEVVVPVWQAVGAVDDDARLTELGAWGLPLSLARAWRGDLDDDDGYS